MSRTFPSVFVERGTLFPGLCSPRATLFGESSSTKASVSEEMALLSRVGTALLFAVSPDFAEDCALAKSFVLRLHDVAASFDSPVVEVLESPGPFVLLDTSPSVHLCGIVSFSSPSDVCSDVLPFRIDVLLALPFFIIDGFFCLSSPGELTPFCICCMGDAISLVSVAVGTSSFGRTSHRDFRRFRGRSSGLTVIVDASSPNLTRREEDDDNAVFLAAELLGDGIAIALSWVDLPLALDVGDLC